MPIRAALWGSNCGSPRMRKAEGSRWTTPGRTRQVRGSMKRPGRGALMVVVLAAGVAGAALAPVSAGAETPAGSPGLSYSASACVEPAALVTVPRTTLKLALPDPFRIREVAPGIAGLVVAVASCEAISVAGREAGPGRFSDVGVMIESPDGTGGEHLYQLWQVSDHHDLVRLMSTVGMATDSADISFEKTIGSAAGSVTSTLFDTYELSVFANPPESGTGTGSNTWWHDGSHGVVRVRNEGRNFAANLGTYVLTLADGSPLTKMLGTTVLTGVGATGYHGEHRGQLSVGEP